MLKSIYLCMAVCLLCLAPTAQAALFHSQYTESVLPDADLPDVCIYSYTTDEICSLDLDGEPGHWEYTDCDGGTAMGIAENVSSTVKGLKVEDKEAGWLFKMSGSYINGQGKCAHKVDGVDIFKVEGFLEYNPDTECLCPDGDGDGDGVSDAIDNCPLIPNADQHNLDGDDFGDACDDDDDGDGIDDVVDACPLIPGEECNCICLDHPDLVIGETSWSVYGNHGQLWDEILEGALGFWDLINSEHDRYIGLGEDNNGELLLDCSVVELNPTPVGTSINLTVDQYLECIDMLESWPLQE